MTTLTVNSVPLKVNFWLFAQNITLLLPVVSTQHSTFSCIWTRPFLKLWMYYFHFPFYIPRPFLLLPSSSFSPSVQEADSQKYKIQQKGRLDCASFFQFNNPKRRNTVIIPRPTLCVIRLLHAHTLYVYLYRSKILNFFQDFILYCCYPAPATAEMPAQWKLC